MKKKKEKLCTVAKIKTQVCKIDPN